MRYNDFKITIRINELTPKNSKIKYTVWCDSEGEKPKFIVDNLSKNEALEVAQEHIQKKPDHMIRIDDTRVEIPQSETAVQTL